MRCNASSVNAFLRFSAPSSASCLACAVTQEKLFATFHIEQLQANYDAQVAEKKRLEEERHREIAEQTEAAKQKATAFGKSALEKGKNLLERKDRSE